MEKSCGAIIFNKDDILLIEQTNNIICFPKGHMKDGESELDTVKREIKEEVGLDIKINKTQRYTISYFLNKKGYKNIIYYIATTTSRNLIIQKKEIKKAFWVNKNKINKYLTYEDLKTIYPNNQYDNKYIKLNKKQYNLFIKLVNKYKEKYTNIIQEIYKLDKDKLNEFNLKKEITLTDKHNKIVKELLESLAREFPVFKLFNITIFITGSFARLTNKINSDIDIHFLYNNIFKPFIWKYEELYFCIIAEVLNVERNNLHSVITTKLSAKKSNYYNNLNDNIYLKVNMTYKNIFNYIYTFYPVTKKRFYLQYQNSKNYYSFNKYIKKELINNNREWAHNFYPIFNKEKFTNNLKKINNQEKYNKNIIKNIDDIINNINSSYSNSNNIKEIKKYYQQKTFGNIFNTLNIIRYINNDITYNLGDIFKTKFFTSIKDNDKIEKSIYEYLWLVKRISYYCKDNNIPYSIHKSHKVNIEFIKDVKIKQKEINKYLIEILEIIKKRIKNER